MARNGSGIRKKVSAKGTVSFQANVLLDGKRRWSNHPTEAEAKAWRAEQIARHHGGVLDLEAGSSIPFAELVDRFVRSEEVIWEPATKAYYQNTTAVLNKVFGDRLAGSIRGPEIQMWLRAQLVEKRPRTVNVYRQVLSRIYSWAVRMEILEASPMVHVQGAREKRKAPPRILKLHELHAILEAAGEHRLYFLTMMLTGLRKGEMERLDWTWIDLDDRWLEVLEGKTGYGKIPLSSSLARELAEISPESRVGRVFAKRSYRHVLAQVLKRAGLDPRGIGLHTFRRTYATMIERIPGTTHSAVKAALRHSQGDVTDLYLVAEESGFRRIFEHLSDQLVCALNVVSGTFSG